MPNSSTSSSERAALTPAYAPPVATPPATPQPPTRSRRSAGALFARAALLACIALSPVAFSAWIDPARLVTDRQAEEEMARALAAGRNVTGFANYDDRALERSLAALRTERPDVLGIGSSRLQPMAASAFPGERFVNAAVQGAVLDDLLAVYALYDTDALRPRRVVLNVDPWTQSYDDPPGWGRLASERQALMTRVGIPVSPWRERVMLTTTTLRRLTKPEYFRHSLFSLRTYGPQGTPWTATDSTQNRLKTKLPNGTVVWSNGEAEQPLPAGERFPIAPVHDDLRFRNLDARAAGRADALEKFVRYLEQRGVAVTVLIVPFPAEIYDELAKQPGHTVVALEAELRALAARTGAEVAGGFDPRPFGLTSQDFFDATHLRPAPLGRLVRGVRGGWWVVGGGWWVTTEPTTTQS